LPSFAVCDESLKKNSPPLTSTVEAALAFARVRLCGGRCLAGRDRSERAIEAEQPEIVAEFEQLWLGIVKRPSSSCSIS